MRKQRGYVFHKGHSWFVRYFDNVVEKDGTIRRRQMCKRLPVDYGGQYRSERSVARFVEDILRPINSGKADPQGTMMVADYIETHYFPFVCERLRASTLSGYRYIFNEHLKPHLGDVSMRDFRTFHGEKLMQEVARRAELSTNTLKHLKHFLTGVFRQALRLGVIEGENVMREVSVPQGKETADTYAYDLRQVRQIVEALADNETAQAVVLVAAYSGLRKGEIRGLLWKDYSGHELSVERSVWKNTVNAPKTRSSKATVPVIKQLAEALDRHRERMGKLAQPDTFIFQAGNGQPLNLDNTARRVIRPALRKCVLCGKMKPEHGQDGHEFQPLPRWHGWHAFRRGLATTLNALGVDDKATQTILRHSDIKLTQNIYMKPQAEVKRGAMEVLETKLLESEKCNDSATPHRGVLN
jgi:integrase